MATFKKELQNRQYQVGLLNLLFLCCCIYVRYVLPLAKLMNQRYHIGLATALLSWLIGAPAYDAGSYLGIVRCFFTNCIEWEMLL